MNTKFSFLIRLSLIVGLALTLIAAGSASASNLGSLNNLASPVGWLAFRPPLPGIMAINASPDTTTTTEDGGSVIINVHLDSAPPEDVNVPVSSDNENEGKVSPASLIFTTTDYATPKPVTVTGQNDYVADGDVLYNIQIGPGSAGENPAVYIALTNTDDDIAGVTVDTGDGVATTEAGTDTFTVQLTSQPTDNVDISFTSSDTAEGTVPATPFTFTADNWDSPQDVTVTGTDDDVDEVPDIVNYNISINVSSEDGNYDGIVVTDIPATNTDDDTAGVTVDTGDGVATTEAGTDTFTVQLTSQPTDNVDISFTSSDTAEGTVPATPFTFTADNWDSPQDVTVTGTDDDVDEVPDIVNYNISINVSSEDGNYDGIVVTDIPATNTDNDTAGITLTPATGLITTEAGGTATFNVQLASQPTAEVTLGLSSSDVSEGDVAPTSMIFTTTEWATPQTATVTGKDDKKRDGSMDYQINVDVSSTTDTIYGALPTVSAGVTNTDDDTPGITVTPTTGLVTTEAGGTATFSVVLNTEPASTVSIGLTSSNEAEGIISKDTLTFTTTEWEKPQEVTITGVDDDIDDDNIAYQIVTAAAASSDPDYEGRNAEDVSVTNTDNDDAGFKITPKEGLITTESGGAATFEVSLKSEPTTEVTLNLGSDDVTEGQSSPMTLTFTATDWYEIQVVTVVGVDDDQIDGDIAYKIVTEPAISDDPKYDERNPSDVSVTNQDDDVAGFLVVPTSGLITAEYGLQAFFTVTLDTQPTDEVSLTLQSSDTTEGTVSPASLTFTPDKWNTPQIVTITGKNDFKHDGNIPYKIITNPATSDDPNYNGVDAADVSVTNSDDDTPGFIISPGTLEYPLYTSEGEASTSINILLSTEPAANVVFTFTSLDTSEGVFSLDAPKKPKSVTFTPTNWNILQTIQLIGVDDTEADGDIHYTIDVQSSSADNDYNVKSQDLFAINMDAPTIAWILPKLNEDGYYEIIGRDPFLAGVEPISDEPISRVSFYRWDTKLGKNITLFEDNNPPYQFYIYPENLEYEWTQIWAYAIDINGEYPVSKHVFRNVYRVSRFWLYLPVLNK